jgi:hypothetical protein
MLFVSEYDVQEKGNYAELIAFLALKRKKSQLTIKNGPCHPVVFQPGRIPVSGSELAPPRIVGGKSG